MIGSRFTILAYPAPLAGSMHYMCWTFGWYCLVFEAPATPTPFATPTINPTLESAFIGQQTATHLPTFTPPPPLEVPAFRDETTTQGRGIPSGLLILALGLFGFLGAVISYLRGRVNFD